MTRLPTGRWTGLPGAWWSGWRGLDRRPYLTGAAVFLVAGVLGMAWVDSALVGLVVLVAVHVTVALLPRGGGHPWPRPADLDADGARREVTDITWMLAGRRDGRVSEEAVRRLRSDATRCLARRGIAVPGGLGAATPRRAAPEVVAEARAVLGERVWRIVTSPGGHLPSLADVAYCVDVLEHLPGTARPASGTPSQPPNEGPAT